MKKWIWFFIFVSMQMSLMLSSCSTPDTITVTKTVTDLPVLKSDTPMSQASPFKTKALVKTKTSTPVILYELTETSTPLDKKRRYEAHISYKQMQMIAVAIDEYNNDHGSYPDSLKDLVPDYLDKVPHTITGQEIIYRKIDYSIYILFFDLAYWENKNGCVYHGRTGEFECSPKYDD